MTGVAGAGVGPALLLIGLVAVLLVCRRLRSEDREILLAGLIGIGLLVSLTGWLGVVGAPGVTAALDAGRFEASTDSGRLNYGAAAGWVGG
jgi:hypothetical protein